MQKKGKNFSHKPITLTLLILLSALTGFAQNDQGFIYGKVTTVSGEVYTGQIRWGKEEIYWNDFFNSTKISNSHSKHIPKDVLEEEKKNDSWINLDWKILSIWDDKANSGYHQFIIQFGDIRSLIFLDDQKVEVVLKNGSRMLVKGGSNDIGTYVKVYDMEIGNVDLKWNRIDRVDFMATPTRLKYRFGAALHGKVETYRKGTFNGYVQWDHDERIDTDILDGDTRDGDVKIPFKNIKILESKNNGTIVVTDNNRSIYLTGSNDVNQSNRGIIVTVEGVGKIDIPWKDFKKVTFSNTLESGSSYDTYASPRAIRGTVRGIDGNAIEGMIVYDLDESWDFEILDGKDDDVKYYIPFKNIKSIIPKNYNYSIIILKNGQELLLGDERDVNEDNDGLLIFKNNKDKPEYIKWNAIDEIVFH